MADDQGRTLEGCEEEQLIKREKKKFTSSVLIACVIAASSGLMFGYVIGISGGVSAMKDFLAKFFPSISRDPSKGSSGSGNYCRYNDQLLQLFTSSTYIVGLISTFGASYTTRDLGRKPTMLIAGIFYLVGTVLNAGAQSLPMLIIGRVFLGCGIGFGNQATPLYLSEVAPPHLRGGLNILFQLNITTGILIANLVNYFTAAYPWGWRLSFALGGIPSLLLTLGSFVLSETPNSLIERGYLTQGKQVLEKIRGTDQVEEEFNDLVEVGVASSLIKNPFRDIIRRKNLPPLICAICLQFFQQAGGINAIMFYSPVLFETVGFGSNASLVSTVVIGGINAVCTIISMVVVDRFGRKILLLEAGVQLFIAQVGIAILLGLGLKDSVNLLTPMQAMAVVLMVCLFISGFAWSWGPLAWLVASEVFPLEVRSAGQSITVSTNLLFTFAMAQSFLSMLCVLKYGIFILFAAFLVAMTLFAALLLPETKGIPIEEMSGLWKRHWLWRRFV
ncbi:hypothetical protein SELMODRAFT_94097 [Selaginella moellendorffii]|uniref:Uncharacterized protein MST8-2 n=1 Tax=Selaginella moellendorffii TaxID=88036 RepID=D8RI92_SELML|nr:hypothetical protein SELMODRAFT_94097 [Selaginella moellendorffii]